MATHAASKTPKAYRKRDFDLKGLAGISDAQIEEHLVLYAGYVKQVNTLNQELGEMLARGKASGKSPEFAELTRRVGFEYDGMILHEYYFGNLRAAADPKPSSSSGVAEALDGSFGSVDRWRTDFRPSARCAGLGVILFQDPVTDRLTNHWITLHQDGVPAGFKPLLVMDVWGTRDYA